MSWRENAKCRGLGELFQPVEEPSPGGGSIDVYRHELEAKAVCAGCTVFGECAEWVGRFPQPVGIWAGMTPVERHAHLSPGERRVLRGARYKPCEWCGDLFSVLERGAAARTCGEVCQAAWRAQSQKALARSKLVSKVSLPCPSCGGHGTRRGGVCQDWECLRRARLARGAA